MDDGGDSCLVRRLYSVFYKVGGNRATSWIGTEDEYALQRSDACTDASTWRVGCSGSCRGMAETVGRINGTLCVLCKDFEPKRIIGHHRVRAVQNRSRWVHFDL